jgi:hypothetical protein
MDKRTKEFFKFLKENDALEKYLSNIDTSEMSPFSKMSAPRSYIALAFAWSSTKEGWDFWSNLHTKWCSTL